MVLFTNSQYQTQKIFEEYLLQVVKLIAAAILDSKWNCETKDVFSFYLAASLP